MTIWYSIGFDPSPHGILNGGNDCSHAKHRVENRGYQNLVHTVMVSISAVTLFLDFLRLLPAFSSSILSYCWQMFLLMLFRVSSDAFAFALAAA